MSSGEREEKRASAIGAMAESGRDVPAESREGSVPALEEVGEGDDSEAEEDDGEDDAEGDIRDHGMGSIERVVRATPGDFSALRI